MELPVFAINLEKRKDRKTHILNEFSSKSEFGLQLISPIENKAATISLWQTIRSIVQYSKFKHKLIILCEDDHQFTECYSKDILLQCISEARFLGADMLSGGVASFFSVGVQVTENLFWVDKFNGLQFTVIFDHFFETILNTDFNQDDTADHMLSSLSESTFVIYPFISVQKEFGYSDVTIQNNDIGLVTELFENSAKNMGLIQKVNKLYKLKKITYEDQ